MMFAATSDVTTGWKLLAVLVAFAGIVVLWIFASVTSRSWNPWKLVEGADGRPSTSKFQWLVWLVAILFAYVVLWVVRARQGDWDAISDVPTNLLLVLGFSTGTMAAAKGITTGYVQSAKVAKTPTAPTATQSATTSGILVSDTGDPDISKVQMIGFTFVAVGIFLATLIHHLRMNPIDPTLPDIDPSLLVLMGISQGGYLGKKLVTFSSPTLNLIAAQPAAPNSSVTLTGTSLGSAQAGNQVLLNGTPIPYTSWTDTQIIFTVPPNQPGGVVPWTAKQPVTIATLVNGQSSNSVSLVVN
jgi:hypothetical protein